MEREAGVERLAKMAGVESLQRNLEAEDAAVAQNIRAHEQFAGNGGAADTGEGRDDMRIMAAGNVTFNNLPAEKQPAAESPAKPPQPAPSSPALKKWIYPLLIAGLMGGSSLAGSLLTRWWSHPAKAVDTDTDTQYEFGISSRP